VVPDPHGIFPIHSVSGIFEGGRCRPNRSLGSIFHLGGSSTGLMGQKLSLLWKAKKPVKNIFGPFFSKNHSGNGLLPFSRNRSGGEKQARGGGASKHPAHISRSVSGGSLGGGGYRDSHFLFRVFIRGGHPNAGGRGSDESNGGQSATGTEGLGDSFQWVFFWGFGAIFKVFLRNGSTRIRGRRGLQVLDVTPVG